MNEYVEKHPKSKYIDYLVAAPDLFHLMCKLLIDKRVPFKNKAIIAGAVLYFISPLDIISDLIPGVGLMDDIFIAAFALNSLLQSVDEEVIIELWAGNTAFLRTAIQTFFWGKY